MLSFETINELTLKVTCTGSDVLFVKAGAFIAGDNCGPKNYRFEKVLLGPQQSIGQALFGQLARRVTGENIPLMKVSLNPRIFWHLPRIVITASVSSVWVYFPKKVLLLPHLRPEAGMHMLPYCQTATLLY